MCGVGLHSSPAGEPLPGSSFSSQALAQRKNKQDCSWESRVICGVAATAGKAVSLQHFPVRAVLLGRVSGFEVQATELEA